MTYSVVWSKVLLSSLRYVKRICRQIDKAVDIRSKAVPGLSAGFENSCENALEHTQKVIDLIEKKKRALKLSYFCSRLFEDMTPLQKKVIYEKFYTGNNYIKAAERLGLSVRTYYRRVSGAVKTFTCLRKKLGISDEYLDNLYYEDNWILKLKINACKGENKRKVKTKKELFA